MASYHRKKYAFLFLFGFISLFVVIGLGKKNRSFDDSATLFPLLSATNFEQLQNMTYGAVRRKVIIEQIEIVQFDMMSDVVQKNSIESECIHLKNANPAYHACMHSYDAISDRVRRNLYWERGTQKLIKQFFDDNPVATFVDLGTNVGYHSLFAANLNTNVRVLSVEPFPQNILLMHKAAHLNNVQNQIEVVLAAVSNQRGLVTFYQKNNSMSKNSLLETGELRKQSQKGFTTNSILLDDLIPFIKTRTVCLKIDIEGYECYVITRAAKFFEEFDVRMVFTEIRHTKSQPCFEEMVKFFKDRNYEAYPDDKVDNPLDYKTFNNWTSHDMNFKKVEVKSNE
jgi:FkbM family methyltransferase